MKTVSVTISAAQAKSLEDQVNRLQEVQLSLGAPEMKLIGVVLLRLKINIATRLIIHSGAISVPVTYETALALRYASEKGYLSGIEYKDAADTLIGEYFRKCVKKPKVKTIKKIRRRLR